MIFRCKIVLEFIRFKTPYVIYRILNTKGIKFNKTFTFTEGVGSTKGFVQVGLDVETSATVRYQLQFQLDVINLALGHL